MNWNNRLCRSVADDGEEYFTIREVFYDDEGRVDGWTADPIVPLADSPEDLVHQLRLILADCRRMPVLDLTTLEPQVTH